MIGRALVIVAVLAVGAFTYPGATAVSFATWLTPPPAATGPAPAGGLPWLHVAHPPSGLPYVADASGRMVLLHGAIPASLLEFGGMPAYPVDPAAYAGGACPPNSPASRYPPLCEADIAQMAALGFNSIRLPISWSLLEPERGRFNSLYLDRIAQVVGWARAAGLYVIVDMHQNAYSHFIPTGPGVNLAYNSGAPAWATFTDGFPSRVLFAGQRESNPAVLEATTNFWYDRGGIQDEYIAALAVVVRRFESDPVVAGYGVYNEPLPGWNLSPGFEDLLLFPFYRRVIDALTGARDGLPCWSGFFTPAPCGYRDLGVHDRRQLFFLDTGLLREVTDFPTHLGLPVTSYPNVVLALHAYTHIYTFDTFAHQDPRTATYPWGGYDQSYAFAEREAKAMRAALFVSEFGNGPADDGVILANQIAEQERHRLGFAFWTWKENGSGGWGMFDPPPPSAPASSAGCIRLQRNRMLAQVYPALTADPSLTYAYEPASGAFTLSARGRAGDAPTIVVIPRTVTGGVSSSGAAAVTVTGDDGAERLVTAVPEGGEFTISVAPAPLLVGACT